MAGKDVWHVLEESATVACHRVWLLRSDHLLIAAEVFKAGGHTIRSISMIAVNAVIHLEPCSERKLSILNLVPNVTVLSSNLVPNVTVLSAILSDCIIVSGYLPNVKLTKC